MLKDLLESKHLYQGVLIDHTALSKDYSNLLQNPGEDLWRFQIDVSQLLLNDWVVIDNSKRTPKAVGVPAASKENLAFKVPDVKLFCRECDRIEAYNSISPDDIPQYTRSSQPLGIGNRRVQVFVMSFLCQSCKTVPEVFLIRRKGSRVTICGRAPMEAVAVPGAIPKSVHRFYSGAVVAHQSGQTLAGLFLFRTLVEQWARGQMSEPPNQADQVLDRYMATLPDDFKSRFPSLRALYAELSADIHSASGSEELFGKAGQQIVEHFEARRLFKL
ncbi:MAG: hypothetical protein HYX72_03265 [Acidobacteria bacterium]|nr:hypothetical protein [Acidobacteriota bacterium]